VRIAGLWRAAGACAVLTLLASPLSGDTPAFPGAEGFGRYSRGGRGGRVVEVTTLDDAGEGSLRAAVEAPGPRTVIFRLSGTIHLRSPLVISRDSITIAGQTAPGDGVCIADQTFSVQADHVVIRYMRFRLGDLNNRYDDDALNGCRNIQRGCFGPVIIDHCSASWSVDEAASFYDNRDFTLQWCFITESLDRSHHAKGPHGYGGIWGGQRATFHHNLLAHHTSRNPRFNGGRTTGEPEKELVDHRNNVVYNWGFNSAYGGEGGSYNIVGNYYKSGPATDPRVARRILQPFDDSAVWYVSGNVVEGFPAVSADNWLGVDAGTDVDRSKIRRADAPFPAAPFTEETAEKAYALVLERGGATLPRRDRLDERIVAEVKSGTATFGGSYRAGGAKAQQRTGIIDSQTAVGGWPHLQSALPPSDSDHDGMPDEWETRHGLDPRDPSDGPLLAEGGYTNLEVYLNAIVEGVVSSGKSKENSGK
jgi:hypothetical protein